MVALLHPSAHRPATTGRTVRRVPRRAGAPSLRLIQGGRSERRLHRAGATLDPFSMLGVVGVMAIVLLVVLVRGVQGAPPADDWASLAAPSVQASPGAAPASSGLATLTVSAEDTWSSIAARVAPDSDPVVVARWLAMQNGGYQLTAGQVLDISPRP